LGERIRLDPIVDTPLVEIPVVGMKTRRRAWPAGGQHCRIARDKLVHRNG
jgi:hypothetical protein